MWNRIEQLGTFYESGLGLLSRRHLAKRVAEMWPDVRGQRILGLGYATPYLRAFRVDAERVIALMPGGQGAQRWPREGANLVALSAEDQLPLPDRSMDKVLLVHAIEVSETLRPMLREVWRVLTDDGRLMVVAPSRRGLWARLERTPFGYGRPFTDAQMSRLLRDAMFTPLRVENALFFPPFRSRLFFASAPAWENIGVRWFPAFAGVTLTEASKETMAGAAAMGRERRKRLVVPVAGNSANRNMSGPARRQTGGPVPSRW